MSKRPVDGSYAQESAPMEQVRELLFGAQLKDMEIRFKRQEERFLREIAESRDSLKKRLDSLENFMKSESSSLLNRLKEEQEERVEAQKAEQRERQDGLKAEQRERAETLRNEQRERSEALAQMARDIAGVNDALERKISKVAGTLDNVERELRQLMLSENSSLNDKIEEKYQDALNVLSSTAAQIRHDMVYRSSLSSMFTEVAVKLSGQWTPEVGHMLAVADAPDYPGALNGEEANEQGGEQDNEHA